MQVALKPGQSAPHHNANSNVYIVVMKGELEFILEKQKINAKEGDIVPVAHKTPMDIKNIGQENAMFLIFKTPNPSEMKKE